MSLLIKVLLLLATLVAVITVSSAQTDFPTAEGCPPVKVLRGRDGRDGLNGARGEQGPVGLPGHKGDPGVQGPIGISGPQGAAGEKGQPGLHGEKGQDGQQGQPGEKGEQGALGVKGDPGLQGPQGEQGVQGPPSGGVTYTRWGRTNCSTDQGTELVYSGRAGGTHYRHSGGGANFICLPDDPDHLQYRSGVQGWSYVAGVEYQYGGSLPPVSSFSEHNVPCAVCYVATRSVSLMIPAKTQCPTLWTLEYTHDSTHQ